MFNRIARTGLVAGFLTVAALASAAPAGAAPFPPVGGLAGDGDIVAVHGWGHRHHHHGWGHHHRPWRHRHHHHGWGHHHHGWGHHHHHGHRGRW